MLLCTEKEFQLKSMSLTWKQSFKNFENYLRLEKSLSENSIEAYLNDIRKLEEFTVESGKDLAPSSVTYSDLKDFINWFRSGNKNARTQAKVLSGIRAFYKFLLIDGEIDENPSSLLESPRIGMKLPEILSVKEIDRIASSIALSQPAE